MIHSNSSWLVWGRNWKYDVCCFAQTAQKLVSTHYAKQTKDAKNLLSSYLYTVSKGHNEATSGGRSDTASILSMPKPRLRFLQLVRTQLLRQSEDCLYLNVFVPKTALVAASAASKASDGRPRKRQKQQQKRGKNRIHHSSILRVPCVTMPTNVLPGL